MQTLVTRTMGFTIFVVLIYVAPALCAEPKSASDPVVSHMPRQEVQSTAIAKVGYSKRRHILEIEFVNGACYRYLDVPAVVYGELMSAESKARFYDSNIRKHYRSVLVRARQKEQAPEKSSASVSATHE
jgi:KTSC domain